MKNTATISTKKEKKKKRYQQNEDRGEERGQNKRRTINCYSKTGGTKGEMRSGQGI